MPEANGYQQSNRLGGTRMNVHKYARLTPKGREILVRRVREEGLRVAEAVRSQGVSVRTAGIWQDLRSAAVDRVPRLGGLPC